MPSINEARAIRRRAIVHGKVRIRDANQHYFWLWTVVGFAVFGAVYWWYAQSELTSQKSAVMARQRAVFQELGPRIVPFRDQLEAWVVELAGPWQGSEVSEQFDLDRLRRGPGVYLRLRLKNATSNKRLRKAAAESLHDGFTSCLFINSGKVDPTKGPECRSVADCETGLLCNEWSVCSPPTQPFNLRLAYRALRILSPDWTDELHSAGTDLAVRVFERDLDKVTENDVPIAIDVLSTAQFFTVVLDEEASTALAANTTDVDAGVPETAEQRLHRTPHTARVGIWDIRKKQLLLRLREQAAGRYVPTGAGFITNAKTRLAQQRQVNSCALAVSVRELANRARSIKSDETQKKGGSPGPKSDEDSQSPLPSP